MTISYTKEVATCQGFSCFLKLLIRWRGSIYKLVWRDLIAFLVIYYVMNFIYRFALPKYQQELFESIVEYCRERSSFIPISFVLGFYVSIIMTRWWGQYVSIPRPDPIALLVSSTVKGQDEHGRVIRRTIMRYVCLAIAMVFTCISPRVKKRFPSLNHFVKAGLLEENEANIFKDLNDKFPAHAKYWLPLVWAASIVVRARNENRITQDYAVKALLDEINKCRAKCARLIAFDRISIPLVYTQVVTIAVYTYFMTAVMAHQSVNAHAYKFDLYFPVFTLLQFFFFVGWLKVAESLINPFGDDDDDFEVNWMIDRDLQVSYIIVDEMHDEHPELMKDQYWDQMVPEGLPYTPETAAFKEQHPFTSTVDIAASVNASMRPNQKTNGSELMARERLLTNGSEGSQNSLAGPSNGFGRRKSLSSSIKRLLTRQNSKPDNIELEDQQLGNLKVVKDRLIEIIEEVDEQITVRSKVGGPVPSVFNVFGSETMPRAISEEELPLTLQAPSNLVLEGDNQKALETKSKSDFDLLREQRLAAFHNRIKENLDRYFRQYGRP